MSKRPVEKEFNNKNILAFQREEIARFKRLNKTKVLKTKRSVIGKIVAVDPPKREEAEAIG